MDGSGWKPEYGLSAEGEELLGFVEALPADARREIVAAVAAHCRAAGYVTFHDDLHAFGVRPDGERPPERLARVIPFRRRSSR